MIFCFYDPGTGLFTGRRIKCTRLSDAERNAPDGMAVIPGDYDHRCQRVDLETGEVVDWQPPKPGDDHEWSADRKRWIPTQAAIRKQSALAEIRRLERAEQPRALREAVLGLGDQRLREIEDKIAKLRAVISTAARPGET